jgi:uncharacterized membrane protein (UPF0182 family)
MIDAASGGETVMQDPSGMEASYVLIYQRCPFSEDKLKALISPEPSTVPADELTALRFPSEDLVASPEVAALVEALRAP